MEMKQPSTNSDASLDLEDNVDFPSQNQTPRSTETESKKIARILAVMHESQRCLALPWMKAKLEARWKAQQSCRFEPFVL